MSIFIPNRAIKLPKDISEVQDITASVKNLQKRDSAFIMGKRFDGSLADKVTNTKAQCTISGTRYGIVNGVVTAFEPNIPPVEDKGLRACPAFTEYFSNTLAPATQSITLAAGTYCLWIEGSGSASYSGNTATQGSPSIFTLGSSTTANCVITGTVTRCILNSGAFPAPFVPVTTAPAAFVSEVGGASNGTSFDLDASTLSRLKAGLRGPNAQGHIEFEFESNVGSEWLVDGTAQNIMSLNNSSSASGCLIIYKTTGGAIQFWIRDSAATFVPVGSLLTVGQTFKIVIDYGTYTDGTQKMRLTVNGVKSSIVAFSGSWGTGDLIRGFGNTVNDGWVRNFKYYARPQW